MTTSQAYRISGLASLVGAITFPAHIVLRSVITAGLDPSASAQQGLWVPINVLGVLGAVLVLLGLPAIYARVAEKAGLAGFVGIALIALAWMFFGLFLSLYAVLVLPWLANGAPTLVAASAPPQQHSSLHSSSDSPHGSLVPCCSQCLSFADACILNGSGTYCLPPRSGCWSGTWSLLQVDRPATWQSICFQTSDRSCWLLELAISAHRCGRSNPPNNGMQATALSLRFSTAPDARC